MNQIFLCCFIIIFSSCLNIISASPKKYNGDDSKYQSLNRYYESNLPSSNSAQNNTNVAEAKVDKESRFGIPISTYGNTGSGVQYGNNGYMVSPLKIDLGGLALGALIGLGAVLLVPKLAGIFTGGYGYRSIETDMSSVTEVLSRIDNSLEQFNIDSSSCMQRVICTYVNEAKKNLAHGEGSSFDEFLVQITNNSLFTYMLDGTAIKEAVEMGKKGDIEKCSQLSEKCALTKENLIKVLASLLPA